MPIPMEADDSSVYYESEYENIIEFDPLHKAMGNKRMIGSLFKCTSFKSIRTVKSQELRTEA